MKIGCVMEAKTYENRVGLTPFLTKAYVENGHEVYVEKDLGLKSGFTNKQYIKAGATVLDTAKEVWDVADMILKVKELIESEFDFMREGQIIFTYLHLAANKKLTQALVDKKVKAVAYETVTNDKGELVLLKPMSEIAGKLAVLEGSKYLESLHGGKGVLISGTSMVEPAKVVIVGIGSVGHSALVDAYGLGAKVTTLVRRESQRQELLEEFNHKIKVRINSDEVLREELEDADLVISSVLVPGSKAEQLIRREHLDILEDGSVIVDVAIDQGGSTEMSRVTTHDDPIFIEQGIVHYCVANMGGAVPNTGSRALDKATAPYGLAIANKGLEQAAKDDPGLLKGINVYLGDVVNKEVADELGFEYKELVL
ncbi:MAG TPA: alanine dehydrogenase [Erysipelotrichaceae bacterium]|nr:alanine dehydrogenase [Erysipelotrichaceae bacterium]